ncbi:hypothetical protein Sme01_24460 [Sphaerisporangium melleum]|uniref:CDP-alcohol phosphatidyltransferase n=1 Tax=Sphaerisporangium melleum TaxID=321316 RepID=A0A917QSK2_9ACTN|nr:CDP-alcohol phosphatidyltransferase family protein [Sphaerisporangium melleum]GGK65331.1 hypothetical protein GCM10007964_05470 [Sphaerisporangium melleum]GII69970.1 hypothetical protein Sme01_24460 [Sphaerisporangium melleum]
MPASAYPPPERPPGAGSGARGAVSRPGRPPGRRSSPVVAVVLATTPQTRLECAEGTLVERLADQLVTLEAGRLHVVTRAVLSPALATRAGHAQPAGNAPPVPVPRWPAHSAEQSAQVAAPSGVPPEAVVPRTGTASPDTLTPDVPEVVRRTDGPPPDAPLPDDLAREVAGTDISASGLSEPDISVPGLLAPDAPGGSDGVAAARPDESLESLPGLLGGEESLPGLPRPDRVRSSGLPGDLRAVAAAARAGEGPVAVLPGDLVAHTEALALLLDDPARGTAVLIAAEPGHGAGGVRAPVRAERGRVVAAGNSFHTVTAPNARFQGVLHVAQADLASFAEVAEELANLAGDRRLGSAGEAEVTELLLAGLVRVGVAVRAVPLGLLHCTRVTGQREADAAIAHLAEVDEDRARLAAAVKSEDGFAATFLVSSWSGRLVRLAARAGLTPNAVTGLSVGLAGLAAVAFSAGQRRAQLVGAVLLYLSFVLDCVDGQLARYTRAFSPLGAWLDATFDRVKEYVVYVGLAVGYAGAAEGGVTGPEGIWALAVAAMLLQAIRHMIDFSYAGARADAAGIDPIWERPGHGGSLDLPAPRAGASAGEAAVTRRRGGGGLVVRLSARLDRNTASRWLKKIVVLPIGERMLLIAVTAALFNGRVTFLALLAWGGLAALYTLTGRFARSL